MDAVRVCATDDVAVAVVPRFVFPLKGQSDIKCWRKNNMKYYFASHSCHFSVCYSNVWMPVSPFRIFLIWIFFSLHHIDFSLVVQRRRRRRQSILISTWVGIFDSLQSLCIFSIFCLVAKTQNGAQKAKFNRPESTCHRIPIFPEKKYASTAGCRSTFGIISIKRRTEMIFQWRAAKATHTHTPTQTECFDVFKCRLIRQWRRHLRKQFLICGKILGATKLNDENV